MVRCASKNGHKKRTRVLKREWVMCSNYANHSRFISQHNGGGGEGRRPI